MNTRTLSLSAAALAVILAACSSTGTVAPSQEPAPAAAHVTPEPTPAVTPYAPTPRPTVRPTPVPTPAIEPISMADVTTADASQDCDTVIELIGDEERVGVTTDLAVIEASLAVLGKCTTGEYVKPAVLTPRGQVARAGTWDVKVNGKVNWNAWPVVKRENMFNDKNPAGTKMVIIPIAVTNRGTEAATLLGETGYVVGDATGIEITDFDDPTCGVIPKELDAFKTVRPGGTLKGNMCFVVENADIPTLRLGWPGEFLGDEADVEFSLR